MNRDRLLHLLIVFYALALLAALGILMPKPAWLKKKLAGTEAPGALAIINIYGPIHTNQSASSWGPTDADGIARQLHRLSKRDDVKAILLRINSPGGTVGAVQEINTEVLRCKAKGKIIVASFGDVAASGGYYLGAAADRIVADPGTITGSIGVIMEFGNLEGLFQKLGVKLVVIKTGAHKDIGSPARPLTDEERKLLQDSMNDAFEQFIGAVEAGRKMPDAKLRALADGRIFTGRQAMKEGLVDELGNREDAIQAAIKLAHLPAKPEIITESGTKSFSGLLQADCPPSLAAIRWKASATTLMARASNIACDDGQHDTGSAAGSITRRRLFRLRFRRGEPDVLSGPRAAGVLDRFGEVTEVAPVLQALGARGACWLGFTASAFFLFVGWLIFA